jgi:hypothetical protein
VCAYCEQRLSRLSYVGTPRRRSVWSLQELFGTLELFMQQAATVYGVDAEALPILDFILIVSRHGTCALFPKDAFLVKGS